MNSNRYSEILLIICLCLFCEKGYPNQNENIDFAKLKYKTLYALRTDHPPKIDGILDDEIWEKADVTSDFLQFFPYGLVAPSLQTDVYVMYDDNYLYIGVYNHDPEPDKIVGLLARRDDWMAGFATNSDWIGIGIDSNNDNKTGYWFSVNAAEIQVDMAINEGEDRRQSLDPFWNAVWDSKVSIDKNGWTAELRIPLEIFPYSPDQMQEWGISFGRCIQRLQEEDWWPGRVKGVRGMVPHYGIMKGIENLPQHKQLDLRPYFLSGRTTGQSIENTYSLGLDAQYNLSSNTTVNLALNPDFGQVEADPSILNLTAFETRLDERRPFFVEGANFFKNRINLFHSRRIGQRPDYFSPEVGSIIDQPQETTILSAIKLLGERASGLRYGFIDVITDREYGTREYEEDGQLKQDQFLLEPYKNYLIGRIQKPVINDLSTIGITTTDLRRQNDNNLSRAFSFDWRIILKESKFSFSGQLINSRNDESIGYGGYYSFNYRDPSWWELGTYMGIGDKTLDLNDIGFLPRSNMRNFGLIAAIRRDDPKGIFISQNLSINYNLRTRYTDRTILRNAINVEQRNTFTNYWSLGLSIVLNPEVFSDNDLYRDSRAEIIREESRKIYRLWIQSDRRKQIILKPNIDLDYGNRSGLGTEYGINIIFRPTDNINLSINSSDNSQIREMQWIGVIEDSLDMNIIYASSKQITKNTNIRLNWAFSPTATLECFYQPFVVNVDYSDYGRLIEEKSYMLEDYAYPSEKSFKINNHVGTFVFRWEYSPGSLVYLVYSLNEKGLYSQEENAWTRTSSNSLFLKLSYFFQP
jgi:hypothetical protein|tara:strand:- start:242 stop:2668 length:2427 start_codon:yes stop_codon:yes gene_type:complete